MESVIRVIKGIDQGATAALLPGQTVLGRGAKAGLKLTAPSVSWEHAVISRDGDDYFVENLSAHGTLINDTKISGKIRLKSRDILKLSDEAVLRFEPSGAPQGLLARRNLLIGGVVALLLLGLVASVWNPFAAEVPQPDWNRAYNTLQPWVDQQVQARTLPAAASPLFKKAWRLQKAGDYHDAMPVWLQLRLLLDGQDAKRQFTALAEANPGALNAVSILLKDKPQPTLTEDELAAATVQFVTLCLDSARKKSVTSEPGL